MQWIEILYKIEMTEVTHTQIIRSSMHCPDNCDATNDKLKERIIEFIYKECSGCL